MTATTLRTIARIWPDLHDALGDRTQHAWPPPQLRDYLTALERLDIDDPTAYNTARRQLERSPDQIGIRPIPISLRILDTMRTVEAVLHETATQIASANQHDVRTSHPHRWSFTGTPPGAVRTALWLSARADGVFWPGRALTEAQHRQLGHVAAEALRRIETALDLAQGIRELSTEHSCQCGGSIVLEGGAGDAPTARCRGCGANWTERGVVAA
ncbi:hypothetical protein [Streptomyces sp. NPDC056543]|uniref:hypothetical protein n=1 Tax=unclassified Streptomyces TaxID=2593676 RepID=UPI0036AB6A80